MIHVSCLLMLLVSAPLPAPAGQNPAAAAPQLSLSDYLGEIDRWSAEARRLEDHPEEAAALRSRLPSVWSLTVEGQDFLVTTDWLRTALASCEKNPGAAKEYSRQMRTRLEAMRAEAAALERLASLPRPDTARNKLREILSRREFYHVRGPTPLERLQRRVFSWLFNLLDRILGGARISPQVQRMLGWSIAVGLALLFLGWLARKLLRRPFKRAPDLAPPRPAAKGWHEWARQASAAAARGHYREAIRLAYWAGVLHMEDAGLWKADRARTPREYLRLLPLGHPSREPLANLTTRFERFWYGGQAASADDFQRTLRHLEELGCAFPWSLAIGDS